MIVRLVRRDPGHASNPPNADAPFPLRRRFYAWVLPAIVVFFGVSVAASMYSARRVTEDVYLNIAEKRAEGIAAGVARAAPEAWRRLLAAEPLDPAQQTALRGAFAEEVVEFKLQALKVYDLSRRTLFATNPRLIDRIEDAPALHAVLAGGQPAAVSHEEPDGTQVYELYVPFRENGRLRAVFELYEPLAGLDAILLRAGRLPALVTAALLAALVAALVILIHWAQRDIDRRTATIVSLRRRIERLVSRQAVAAMSGVGQDDRVPTKRLVATLLYTDARGFTAFSEARAPEAVIGLLDKLIGLQVEIVEAHGGDVDKIIGDAILARFDGPGRAADAIAAACAIQRRLAGAELGIRVGVGVFSGPVVVGTMGAGKRLDYTVIGDAVNVAARLCASAAAGEVVADDATLAEAGSPSGFGALETLSVKGRQAPLAARRWRAVARS